MTEDVKGPYLVMASFCEKALQEKDGTFSAIRLIDTLDLRVEGEKVPEQLPKFVTETHFLARFAFQNLSSEHTFKIVAVSDTGAKTPLIEHPITFDKSNIGFNIRIILNLSIEKEGVYWFLIYLDETIFTEVPLKITYTTHQTGESERK